LLSKPVYNGGIHDVRALHDFLPLFFFFLGFGVPSNEGKITV